MTYPTQTVIVLDEQRRKLAHVKLDAAPIGVEVVIRTPVKARKLDQNALMWAGPLKDIEEQAWVNGRTYTAKVWHEQFKREYLPEVDHPDIARLVKNPDKYRKWDRTPRGDRALVGSTTDLTVYGFAQYLEQVYAEGASMGVLFSASPR